MSTRRAAGFSLAVILLAAGSATIGSPASAASASSSKVCDRTDDRACLLPFPIFIF
ncbi:MAG: hypothetical protein M3R01_02830 [Actinomycetota bacterium]|nr:hypothetical protein [Actinomycetota bacterium]